MKTILILFFLSSCAAYVRTPSTKMISPEAHGGLGKGQFEARLEGTKRDKLDFADNTTKNAIDRAETPHTMTALAEVGFFKQLDLFLLPSFTSSTIYGVKYQLIGSPKSEAKQGNFSTSVLAGLGQYSRSFSSSGDLEEILNDNINKVSLEMKHREVGIISGYRWFDKFIHYGNVIYQREELEGKVTNNSGTLTDAKFNYALDGMIYSTGFIHYFAKAHWKVDYSHYVSQWTRTQKQTVNSLSFALGFDW